MRVRFDHGVDVTFDLTGPLAVPLTRMYRHLQHVALPWRAWDNPYNAASDVAVLVHTGSELGITVSAEKCKDQTYLNYLHCAYEQKYNGDPAWLDFHEHIHRVEQRIKPMVVLDHREFCGPIQQPFQTSWLESAVTRVSPGTVFVRWAELGKTPFGYWRDQEPNDLVRLCELAKPWISLRGKIMVAFEDIDYMHGVPEQQFQQWWQNWERPWCQHWGIESWSLFHQRALIPIGKLDPDTLVCFQESLQQGHFPTHVLL